MELIKDIEFDTSRPIIRVTVSPEYKLYGGELSARHPINVRVADNHLVIVEQGDTDKPKVVNNILLDGLEDAQTLELMRVIISKASWATPEIVNDIIQYVKTIK